MRKTQLVVLACLLILLLAACAPAASPAPQPAAASAPAKVMPAPAQSTAPTRPAWQEEWEKTLAAARQEGTVVVYASGGAGIRDAMVRIARSQGVKAEVLSSRGTEFLARVKAERKAGLSLNDLWIGGYSTMLTVAKPEGLIQPLDTALILPHLTDPEVIKKVWYQGKLPWVDKDHTVMIQSLAPRPALAVNTNLVKPEEVKSYRDLLNPKWKGNMVMNDPTIAGAGQNAFAAIVLIMGEDYARELVKMEPLILRDERQMLEWLAHGKMAIVISPESETVPEFTKIGAPIRIVNPVEGLALSGGGSGISWVSKSAHPNATKVFINWLISKEGQELYSPAAGYHSLRVDASTAHLRPDQMRQEGIKYFDSSTEEFQLNVRTATDKLGKEIFAPKK